MQANIGSMPHRIRTGIAATPNPRMRPGNKPTARAVRLPSICSPLGGIPRPPTRRQPKILPKTGSYRSNLTASLAGGTPYTGRGRTTPRGVTASAAQPHPPPPRPKGQDLQRGLLPLLSRALLPQQGQHATSPLLQGNRKGIGPSPSIRSKRREMTCLRLSSTSSGAPMTWRSQQGWPFPEARRLLRENSGYKLSLLRL